MCKHFLKYLIILISTVASYSQASISIDEFCECETYNVTVTSTAGQAISLSSNIGVINPNSFISSGSDIVQITTICTNSLDAIRQSNLFINNVAVSVELKERIGDFVIWLIGDPHSDTDNTLNIKDARIQLSNFGVNWDIGLMVGDYVGQAGPNSINGIDYLADVGTDFHRIYEVVGNHDADDSPKSLNWFYTYINPEYRTGRPFLVQAVNGSRDAYSFKVHNIQIVGLYDRNDVTFPAGKALGSEVGYPAGTYSTDAISFWTGYLNKTNEINLTFAHHLLHQSTSYTEISQAFALGIHNTYSWYDRRGSSIAYGVWDGSDVSTIDNLNLLQQPNNRAYIKFKDVLNCYDNRHIWVAGHTHPRTTARDIDFFGREMIEEYSYATVINSGTLTSQHGVGSTPHVFSRFIHFYDDKNVALIRTFTHKTTSVGTIAADPNQIGKAFSPGFENDLENYIQLNTNFKL